MVGKLLVLVAPLVLLVPTLALRAMVGKPVVANVLTQSPIPWSPDRPLTWKDFTGRPDLKFAASSLTVYKFSYEEQCLDDAFTFTVTTVFQPEQSWVKPGVMRSLANQMRLLAHEQGHFDLGEVNARRLRRALRELKNPCSLTDAQRRAIIRKYVQEDLDRQVNYDVETGFSTNEAPQSRWLGQIERELKALAEFRNPATGVYLFLRP